MNTERKTETIVEMWLADGFTAQPDVETMLRSVRDGIAGSAQRRHRWWPFDPTPRPPVPGSGPTPARGFTMFSAVKFVAASVTVALLGGFLLAGLLTAPQGDEVLPAAVSASPTVEATSEPNEAETTSVRTDILPGVALTVEEVAPGMHLVLGDGIRQLSGPIHDVAIDGEDQVWVELGSSRNWRIVRLGEAGVSRRLGRKDPWDLDVTPDGRPTVHSPSAHLVYDGKAWVKSKQTEGEPAARPSRCPKEHQFMAGGECWSVGWPFGGLSRVVGGEEQPMPNAQFGLADDEMAWGNLSTGDGTGWVFVFGDERMSKFDGLLRYDRDGWTLIPFEPPATLGGEVAVQPFPEWYVFAPDGTLWLSGWARSASADSETFEWLGFAAITWDGEAWAAYGPADVEGDGASGVHVAQDGSPWILHGGHLFAITPEAVAAAE